MSETRPGKAAIFEDQKSNSDILARAIRKCGWEVVVIASTMIEAFAAIPTLPNLGVDVAFIDGNLSERSRGGSDGEVIANLMNQQAPQVLKIGFSADEDQPGMDVFMGKGSLDQVPTILARKNRE